MPTKFIVLFTSYLMINFLGMESTSVDCPFVDGKLMPPVNGFFIREHPGRSAKIAAPIGANVHFPSHATAEK